MTQGLAIPGKPIRLLLLREIRIPTDNSRIEKGSLQMNQLPKSKRKQKISSRDEGVVDQKEKQLPLLRDNLIQGSNKSSSNLEAMTTRTMPEMPTKKQ